MRVGAVEVVLPRKPAERRGRVDLDARGWARARRALSASTARPRWIAGARSWPVVQVPNPRPVLASVADGNAANAIRTSTFTSESNVPGALPRSFPGAAASNEKRRIGFPPDPRRSPSSGATRSEADALSHPREPQPHCMQPAAARCLPPQWRGRRRAGPQAFARQPRPRPAAHQLLTA